MAENKNSQSQPLHIENTVMTLGKQDLSVNKAFYTYRDMKQDGIISGSMSFIKALLGKGDFSIQYHPKATAAEKAVVDALNDSLNNLEDYSKQRVVMQWLSSLDYGCSLSEVVFERKGGKQVFKTFSPIHLTSVQRFEMKGGSLKK